LLLCIVVLFALRSARKAQKPVPPGPKGWPIIGNFFDLPTSEPHVAASRWRSQYGDITSLNVLGMRIVHVHTGDAAKDLLVKRGAIYSDRPQTIMTTEL
ncbi:hypothetical protein CERSUDRAFT_58113, partial [Gelatoporia subvermispora B]